MANSQPIKSSEVYEKDLFKPLQDDLVITNLLLSSVTDTLKLLLSELNKVAKSGTFDNYKDIKKTEEALRGAKKVTEDLDKIEKDRAKLQERLNNLNDERAQGLADLREEIRLQNKEFRDNAKAAAEANNAYRVLSRRTNEAQATLKKLSAQQLELAKQSGKNTKEYKLLTKEVNEAQKNFDELADRLKTVDDRARDGRRNVGRYEQAVEKLNNTLGNFAKATIVLKVFETIANVFQASNSGASTLEKGIGRLTITIAVFLDRVIKGFDFFKNAFLGFVNDIQIRWFEFLDSLNIDPITIGGVQVFKGLVIDVSKELDNLRKTQAQLNKSTTTLTDVFAGFTDEIIEKIEANDKAIDQNLVNIKQNAILQRQTAELSREIENLTKVYDDDSQTLIDRGLAIQQSIDKQKELNDLNIAIADNEVTLARLRLKSSTDSAQAQADLQLALANRIEIETQGLTELNGLYREQNTIARDLRDVELRFFEEDIQSRIDQNQRLIDDETLTLDERKRLAQENLSLRKLSFQRQSDILNQELEDIRNQRVKQLQDEIKFLDINSNERLKKQQEINKLLLAEQVDFNALLKLSTEELTDFVTGTFGETAAESVLDLIIKRREATQDLIDTQKDLKDIQKEINNNQVDIELQEIALQALRQKGADTDAIVAQLEQDRFEQRKLQLKKEIDLLDEGSQLQIQKQKELNDLLLEEQIKFNEDSEALQQERIESISEGLDLISDLFQERSDKRVQAIDKEISAEEARLQRLEQLAQQGNEDAENNLALTEQRRAELELQRQREVQRQEKRELAFAAIQTYSGKVQAGDPNPLASTVADISVLRAFINALPAFYEGSELISEDLNPTMSGKDGYVVRVDGGERVIPSKENSLIGKMSNTELATIAYRHRTKENTESNFYMDSSKIISELQDIKKATLEKPVYLGRDYNKAEQAIIDKIQKGKALERIHTKTGSVWG